MNPTNSRLTHQRKTGVRARLAWIPAVLLVGFVAVACSPTDYARSVVGTAPKPAASKSACAEKFMVAVVTNRVDGVYACLSPTTKMNYFLKFGWQNDADMQQFLSSRSSSSATQKAMKTFGGNPVSEIGDGPGQSHYLYYIGPIQPDGSVDWTVGVGFDIQVDSQGRIVSIA